MKKVLDQGINPMDLFSQLIGGQIDQLAGDIIVGDEVEFHDRPKIVLPRGMTYSKAKKTLERLQEEAETPTAFDRKFLYRPDDGAFAAFQTIKELFGMSMGSPTMTFFGLQPAETRTIAIGVGQTMQVPWGKIEIPVFPGLEITFCDRHLDKDYGAIFEIHAVGPKKYQDRMQELFEGIDQYLRHKSIYRGKAIIGSDHPEFLDLSGFKPEQVVFSDEVTATLNGKLWAPIRYTQTMREEGVSLKRAVLLHGPYGTGKTSTGQMTALEAVANGWTFISAKPGRDKPEDVLRTARLYTPAVVFVEDIDTATSSGEPSDVTKFLDAFDGISSKGGELIAVMTTNHIEDIHKGMLRPGRLDAVIEIAALDANGIERLIKAVVAPSKLADGIDYAAVGVAMDGFLPAFVRESITSAVTFAIGRLEGASDYTIDTVDLVDAAHSLKPQLAALNDAAEGTRLPTLDRAISDTVREAVKTLQVYSTPWEIGLPIQDAVTED